MIQFHDFPFFKNYVDTCSIKLRKTDGIAIASHNRTMNVYNIFIPLMTNITLDAYVENRKVMSVIEDDQKYNRGISNKYASFFNEFDNIIREDNLQAPLIFKPKWKNGRIRGFYSLNAIDAITANKYCVVTSSAGGGKSMLLQFLTVYLLDNLHPSTKVTKKYSLSKQLLEDSFIPIYVPIRSLINSISDSEKTHLVEKSHLLKFIFKEDADRYEKEICNYLNGHNIIFLFDGVDEIIPEDNRVRIINSLIDVSKTLSFNSRIVFSARDEIGFSWIPKEFKQFRLSGMNRESHRRLFFNVLTELGYSDNDTISLTDSFIKEISTTKLDSELLSSPLFFTLVINMYLERNALPSYKSKLLSESIKLLIERWRQKLLESDYQAGRTNDFLYDNQNFRFILEEAAFNSLINNYILTQETLDFPEVILNDVVMKVFSKERITKTFDGDLFELKEQIISCLIGDIGIIKESSQLFDRKVYHFSHRVFQVYLAANKLSDPQVYRSTIDEILFKNPWNYEHVLLMLIEIMQDNGNILVLMDMVIKILNFVQETPLVHFHHLHTWLTWYMAKIISNREFALLSNISSLKYYRFEELLLSINACIKKSLETIHCRLSNRVFCARYLSNLPKMIESLHLQKEFNYKIELFGDTRFGIGITAENAPEIDWCFIEGGSFELGVSEKTQRDFQITYPNYSLEREMPPCKVNVSAFEMSRFPITISQYRAFCNAGAYTDKSFWEWSNISMEWFENVGNGKKIEEIFDNTANSPVTNISWIEAKGFCEWLSSLTGKNIRLPYEHEWEYASKKLFDTYSVTDVFDENIYVSEKLQLVKPAPVGIYPYPGRIPSDLNGNVWEWTQTRIYEDESLDHFQKDPYLLPKSEYNTLSTQTRMVVRGGCYLNSPFMSRNTYRGRDFIYNQITDRQGFRIVLDKL